MNRVKFKLKFKDTNQEWLLEGPNVREKSSNYHSILNKAITEARAKKGELYIYNKNGSLKEVVKYYLV